MGFAQIKLNLTPAGHGSTLEVNGQDISKTVRALAVRTANDEVTRLTVELLAEGTIEGEGIVEVLREPSDLDVRAVLMQWLDEVDADELELDFANLPMTVGPAEAVLDALRKRAASG